MAEHMNIRQTNKPSSRQFRRWGLLLLVIGLSLLGLGIILWTNHVFNARTSADDRQSQATSAVDRLSPDQHREVEAIDRPAIGETKPLVVIVEFSDFACEECQATSQAVREIASEYGTSVRLIYRDFVEQTDATSVRLAEAGKCAHEQGKFWLFHDRYWLQPAANDQASLITLAQGIGLDVSVFTECLESRKYAEQVKTDYREGLAARVQGTPTMFINGYRIEGALTKQDFYDLLDAFIPELNPENLDINGTNSATLN
ncbi:MAG: DsbA family protein [Patescibacteria group bacterium]